MIPILQDLRLVMARFRAKPAHGFSVSLILALGIGASIAIFTLVDATLFQPFDLPEGDRLVRVDAVNSPADRWDPRNHSNSSYPVYADYRAETSLFSGLAAYADSIAVHVGGGEGQALRVTGAVVTGNYFDVLGARAAFGRTLTPADDRERGGHPVVVLSESLSRTLFGGPDSTGRMLRINGRSFEVVGAMRGARLSTLGGAFGLGASLLLAPMLETFLFDVGPRDPATFIGAALVLATVSAAAGAIPALRASHTDPAAVLRSE